MSSPITVKEEPLGSPLAGQVVVPEDTNNEGAKSFVKRRNSVAARRGKLNQKLNKMMLPKSAEKVLSEVKNVNIGEFSFSDNSEGEVTAKATINDFQYEATGSSELAARNSVCEQAFRNLIIAKIKAENKLKSEEKAADTSETSCAEQMPDDFPWLSLGSYALTKLYAEWEKEGVHVPEMFLLNNDSSGYQSDESTTSTVAPAAKKMKLSGRTELPVNWKTQHPSTLLTVMRPDVVFKEYESKSNFCLGTIIDSEEFIANGRSKKQARRNVAVNVLNTLWNTNFSYES